MERETEQISLLDIKEDKERFDTESYYQRGKVWKREQKQKLIDSILRDYDIPKMYVKLEENNSEIDYEVIDGQQRLVAIWEFFEGKFALLGDAEAVSYEGRDIEIASKKYKKLDASLQRRFRDYELDFVIMKNAIQTEKKDEISELFLRLQNGKPLVPQEKRNAMPGKMRDFVKEIASHNFFEKSCAFTNHRYAHDQIAAKMILLELGGGKPINISDAELNNMYKDKRDFNSKSKEAMQVKKVLDYLSKAFPNKEGYLNAKHSAITLYCLASKLTKSYVAKGTEPKLREWFREFEMERKKDEKRPEKVKDQRLMDYRYCTANAVDKEPAIEFRFNVMAERFFKFVPDIVQKDKKRNFSNEQRLAIFYSDGAKCQICDKDLNFDDDYHADHIMPHAKGGKTIVSNGQATCKACNTSKSDKQ